MDAITITMKIPYFILFFCTFEITVYFLNFFFMVMPLYWKTIVCLHMAIML